MRKALGLILTAMVALGPLHGAPLPAGPPPAGGTVSIEPKTADGDYDASLHTFTEAASVALAARGFTILDDPGHAAYVMELVLSRGEVGTGLARVPGQRAASPAGLGVSVPFSTGRSELVPLERTRLELRMRRRGGAAVVWSGAAVTVREAGTRKGADAAVATDLSTVLLQSYPAVPRDVIGVP